MACKCPSSKSEKAQKTVSQDNQSSSKKEETSK